MVIAIVGLGLIGASFAKAFQKAGEYTVLGIDKNRNVSQKPWHKALSITSLNRKCFRKQILL